MKKILLSSFFSFGFYIFCFGQTWFDDDHTWVYKTGEWSITGWVEMTKIDSIMEGNQLVYVLGVNGESVDQWDWSYFDVNFNIYAYEKDNQIFVKEREGDEYELQYDFNLEVGDSIEYQIVLEDFECDFPMTYYLDSLSTYELGGESLVRQHFSFVDTIFQYEGEVTVIETIGSISGGTLRTTDIHTCVFDGPGSSLCSFRKNDIEVSFFSTLEPEACKDLPSSITDNFVERPGIYPNPTSGVLYISDSFEAVKINIFDTTGKLLSTSFNTNEQDVSILKNGIYMMELIDKSNRSTWRKFIKS